MVNKTWWKSKTLWFNIISMIVLIASVFIGVPWLDPRILAGVITVGNGILRLITKQGIGSDPT